MALMDLNRSNDTPRATLKLSTIVPVNWRRFPPRIAGSVPVYVPAVSYVWPYNGIGKTDPGGDQVNADVNVLTANATGDYQPKNQGNKSNMLGDANRLAVDITKPSGWVGPADPYAAPATPTLASLSPASKVANPGVDIVLELTGTGFLPSSQIKMAGHYERTTYMSPTKLRTLIKSTSFNGVDPAIPVQVDTAGKLSAIVNFAVTA